MPSELITFPFTKGMDRSVLPHRADFGSFYLLQNMRQSLVSTGQIEQTPYFYQYKQIAQGTYWNLAGASVTEPTGSAVRGFATVVNTKGSNSCAFTDYCAFRGNFDTQMQILYQSAYPAGETLNTACLVDVQDIVNLALNLGSTIDIRIQTDGAHFGWQKNGGGYSADIVISTAGNSIDGGNAIVYWLTGTGFNVGDIWSWKRTDCTFDDVVGTNQQQATQKIAYKGDVYFINGNRRLMVLRNSGIGGVLQTPYIRSVGYRPVYGSYLTVFYDHIIVGGFSKVVNALGFSTPWNDFPRAVTVACSDVNDKDNFISTSVNEADQFTMPIKTALTDARAYIVGLTVRAGRLFVVTSKGIFSSGYLGLPTVFSFDQYDDFSVIQSTANVTLIIPAIDRDYLVGPMGVWSFDGASLTRLDAPMAGFNWNSTGSGLSYPGVSKTFLWGAYDFVTNELVLATLDYTLWCFQETKGHWYVRKAYFDSSSPSVTGLGWFRGNANAGLLLGLVSRKILLEDYTPVSSNTPIKDDTAGAAFATPTLITQMYTGGQFVPYLGSFVGGTFRTVKECNTVYLTASVDTGFGIDGSTTYSVGNNVQMKLSWQFANNPQIGAFTTDATCVWTPASPDGQITLVRPGAFRGLVLKVEVFGLASGGTLPPFGARVYGLTPNVHGGQQQKVEQ